MGQIATEFSIMRINMYVCMYVCMRQFVVHMTRPDASTIYKKTAIAVERRDVFVQ